MVTSTRRGPIEDRSSAPNTPRSSARKSKRALDREGEDTPTGAKKRRTSAGGKKSGLNEVHPSPAKSDRKEEDAAADIEEVADTPVAEAEEKIIEEPRPRTASPKVVIRTASSPPPADNETESNTAVEEHNTTPEENSASPVADKASAQEKPPTPKSTGGSGRKKQQQKDADAAPAAEEAERPSASTTETKPQNTRIRFGSEEPAAEASTETQASVPSIQPEPTPVAEDDYESDSDEAPEEVTVASALDKAKAAEAEASRAIKAQEEKRELKRKQREERIAEEQRQKRERLAEEEKRRQLKEARRAKKLAKREREAQTQSAPHSFMPNYTGEIPALLPDSLLEAVGDRRPPTPPRLLPGLSEKEKREAKLRHHIQFLERGEESIKDVKKGSLSLRVLQEQNERRAPKVNRESMSIREKWLKGRDREKKKEPKKAKRKMEFKKVERRTVGGGFLRGED
jgi:hypothetical protein